jgi:hypothetical protein
VEGKQILRRDGRLSQSKADVGNGRGGWLPCLWCLANPLPAF